MSLKWRWNRVNIILVNVIISPAHTPSVWTGNIGSFHWELSILQCQCRVSDVYLNLQFQPLPEVTSLCSAQDRNLLPQLPQHLHQALKSCRSPSICSTIHFSHPVFLSLKMWTDASSTGYGATTDDLRITQGLGANQKKPSH